MRTSNFSLTNIGLEILVYSGTGITKLLADFRRLFDLRWDEDNFGREPLLWTTAQRWIIAQMRSEKSLGNSAVRKGNALWSVERR